METKDFVFPDYFCEDCVLQWVWETYSGLYYQCSDVRMTQTYDEGCVGKCQHGGQCAMGVCKCKKGYWGDYCQYSEQDEEISIIGYFILFVVFVLITSVVAACVYFFFNQSKLPLEV